MKTIRFLYDNYWDRPYGPVTFNSETEDYEADHTQHYWRGRTYHSAGVAAEWLKRRLYAAPQLGVNAFIIDNHNLTNAATLRIQAHNADAWGAPPVNVLLPITDDIIVCFWNQIQYYDYWRVSMADAGNPAGYLQAGRIFLGMSTALSRSFDTVHPITYSDPSLKNFSDTRQVSAVPRTKSKAWEYDFTRISAADMLTFQMIWNMIGRFKPYYICEDPDDRSATTHYVWNINSWNIPHILMDEQYDLSIAVREAK